MPPIAARVLAAIMMLSGTVPVVAFAHTLAAGADACSMLSAAEIANATSLSVGSGDPGKPIPGVLGKCTWTSGRNRVILTLADTRHMQLTIEVQEADGTNVPGLGTKAIAVKGAAFTGGGWIVSVLDAKGGFGVSVLGAAGTKENAIALARVVEAKR